MQENNNTLNLERLDYYLGAMGFLYPNNEDQLEIFNIVHAEYDFKLKDAVIDVSSIINNQLKKHSTINLFNNTTTQETEDLKMAARKGTEGLSQDIIDKMYEKHPKKSDGKE
jgi:hypothetical protein